MHIERGRGIEMERIAKILVNGCRQEISTMIFKGIAHPPAKAVRDHPSDLSAGEMVGTQAGGLPLHVEHDTSAPKVGHVLTSFQGSRGEMRVIGQVTDPSIAAKVMSGELRGLSLGTDCVQSMDGDVLSRYQRELSLCEEGRRNGTWITDIDGKNVHQVAAFSNRAGAQS
tara:strand:+ start:38 stop:547 length:510 start_codon:yes stop_codon:yes gene_type:complete